MSVASVESNRYAQGNVLVGVGLDTPTVAGRRLDSRPLLGTAHEALDRYEHDYEPLPEPAEEAFVWGFCGAYAGGVLEERALQYVHHDDSRHLELRGYALGWSTGDALHQGRLPAYGLLRSWLHYHDAGGVPQLRVKPLPNPAL